MTSLSDWCHAHLGAPVRRVLWEGGHLSRVVAAALADGQEVVVKMRHWDASLEGSAAVHRHVHGAGFPCPRPLAGPVPYGELAASAEVHMPGGTRGSGDDPGLVARTALALHDLLDLCPTPSDVPPLDPPRPWAGWIHPDASPWPPPDEGPPLNGNPALAPLVPLVEALNERLAGSDLAPVVGHVDWYQGNLRWRSDGTLFAADDWDSVSVLPEAAIVGCAAVSARPGIARVNPEGWPGTEVSDSEEFLRVYLRASGHSFTANEVEVSWGAGLWQRVFDAAKRLSLGEIDAARAQVRDADERAERAGLPTGLLQI